MNHHDSTAAYAAFWRAATRRLVRQINVGWWLSGWLPLATVIGLAGMVGVLYVRWRAADMAAWAWGGTAAACVAAGVAAWWRMRGRFESEASARVRLEESLGLQARLTAANAGVGDWPAPLPPTDHRWPVMWQWRQPVATVAFIAAMLALATWVPIAGANAPRRHVIEKPTDARMVEQWIEELRREELIDEQSAGAVERMIKELTERPAEEWYEHATLEAAGTLKEQTASEIRELAENAAAAERAATALQSLQESMPSPVCESLVKDLASALKAIELGGFKPAGDLAKLLGELAPADLGQLTPEQLAALSKRLAANRKALLAALAKCKGFSLSDVEGGCEECSGGKPCGECKGCKAGGGITRGRGDAEMSFGERNDLGTTRTEKVQQEIDAKRAAPDDVLAVVDGEHDVDESAYVGPRAGGGIASDGDGGSAVQVDSLLPAEQSAVRRFFE